MNFDRKYDCEALRAELKRMREELKKLAEQSCPHQAHAGLKKLMEEKK